MIVNNLYREYQLIFNIATMLYIYPLTLLIVVYLNRLQYEQCTGYFVFVNYSSGMLSLILNVKTTFRIPICLETYRDG